MSEPAEVHELARALHRAHWAALDVLHGPGSTDDTPYDLEPPSRRAYLVEQARALIAEGWRA